MMRRGILTTKFTPLGYRCENRDEGWIIEEKEASLVRRIFDLALEGKSTGDIARILNSEHIPTPMKLTGHGYSETFEQFILWEPNTVGSILRNEAYTGVLIQRKIKALIPGKKVIRRTSPDEQFRHEGHHEGIVSFEEWEKAQQTIRPKQEISKRSSIEWALKGKVRCGICNRSMRKENEMRSRITCQRPGCSNVIIEEDLNVAAMQPILRKRRRTLEQMKAIENIDTKSEEERITELRRIQADDYEGYINGDLDGEEFRQRKEKIRAEIDDLENTISEKKEKILRCEEKKKRMQWFLDHSKGEITRQMADEIIDSVIVAKDGVTVIFREGL
ncbi:recombinase family protein [Ruminococcus flavefaciens]|uniref:recombinase family protein n=1 Tax=Ruminococcus flavefaciens TaxID=1265 RepID=UPI0026EC242A|nr:recombinase family protein [Ruminococcus flavefaciens]